MTDNLSSHEASDYDNEILQTIPHYKNLHLETIDLVKSIKPEAGIWLDTGCGTGSFVEKALPAFPRCKFYISDPSDKMLAICKERLKTIQVQLLEKQHTAEIKMPVKPDVITAIQSHHYLSFEERIETTRHCYNLLNKDGLYVTFENIKFESDAANELALQRWGSFQEKQGKSREDVEKHLKRFDKNYFPITVLDHIQIMKDAGFKLAELFWLSNMQAGFYGIK